MTLKFYFTTGSSLGGAISATELNETPGSLFPNVTLAEATAGIKHYKCICVKNTGTTVIVNPGIYFSSSVEYSTSYMAKGLTGKNSTTEQTIANSTTAPTGNIIFQSPRFDHSPLRLGQLNPGDFIHVWLKRVLTINAPGENSAYFVLTGVET